jgi:hypothetical protein
MNAGPGFDLYAHQTQLPGAGNVCPLCRGVGGVDPHPEFVFVCKLCGGPRIPGPPGLAEAALATLRTVDVARKKRGAMKALSWIGWAGVVMSALVGLPIALFSVTVGLITLLLFGGPSIAMALYGASQKKKLDAQLSGSIDAAWSLATAELLRSGQVKNAADLARVTGVDAARATHLMNLATVDVDVGTGLRIAEGPVPLPEDPRFAALEQKAAVEQQAEAEALALEADAEKRGRASH